ncbi:MAG: DegV family protein [Firmicutes bacterium]|nr:DegV family protein [Bacillota bacterium]
MVRIITDSSADIDEKRRALLNIDVLPMTITFGKESYLDGVTLSVEDFFKKLTVAKTLPMTSQVNPGAFEQIFRRNLDAGDETVGVFISADISGTYQSACIARDTVGDSGERIRLVDSRIVSLGLRVLVEAAAGLRDQGHSAAEIVHTIEELKKRARLVAVLSTLKYLKMGGRLSAATFAVGTLLGICPIATVNEGKVTTLGLRRGQKAAFELVGNHMKHEGVDPAYPIIFGDTAAPMELAKWKNFILPKFPDCEAVDGYVGCTVGTHAGPGGVGIGYIVKEMIHDR